MTAVIRWWAIFCGILAGAFFLQLHNLFQFLWDSDHSKISFIALGLFTILSLFIGFLTYCITYLNRGGDFKKYLPACWFGTDALMALGMAGTLVGFMMIYSDNMVGLDTSNIEGVKLVVTQLTKGFTTAVVTTLVGVVTSVLAKTQLISLELDIPTDE